MAVISTGTVNRRYQIVRPLGQGSDADVLLVLDTARDGAARALKLVRGVADEGARERLAGEFRRLAALAHPRLVRVYDLEVADGGPLPRGALFFTADHVEGEPPGRALAAVPETGRTAALLAIAEDVAGALAHVHAAGLTHHDVKPGNLLVDRDGRATLLDLGLSAARAVAGVARGTPAYMSPEAFSGVDDPRVDLYALGATLYEAACGRPPYAAPSLAALVRAVLEDPLTSPRALAPWLPEPLDRVIMKLLARSAGHRHSSAAVLIEDLARVREAAGLGGPIVTAAAPVAAPARGRASASARKAAAAAPPAPPAALLPPPLCERAEELGRLGAHLDALAAGTATGRALLLAGAPGVGKTRLYEEGVRAHQLRVAAGRAPALTVMGDTWPRLCAALHVDLGAEDGRAAPPTRRADLVAAAIGRLAMDRPVLVHLADAATDERSAALVALALAESEGGAWTIVAEVDEAAAGDGADPARVLRLAPLDAAGARELITGMLGRSESAPVSGVWAAALARATGGVPRLLVEAVRAAAGLAGVERADTVPVDELLGEGAGEAAIEDVLRRRVAALPAPARALCEALAVWETGTAGAAIEDLAALAELSPVVAHAELAALASRGVVYLHGGCAELPSVAHARAVYRATAAARRAALHRAARARLEGRPGALRALARHAAAAGRGPAVARLCAQAAEAARAEGDLRGAFEHLGDAARLGEGAAATDALIAQAELGVTLSRYDDAISAARRAAATRDPARRRRAERAVARALARRGDQAGAAELLARLVAADAGDEESRGELARLHVARARYPQALEVAGAPEAEPPESGPLPPGRAARLEAAGLAALYGGDLGRAEAAFARLATGARAAGDRALASRAAGLSGMLAHARGQLGVAADCYGEALAHARAAFDVHAAAAYALNGAAALAEQGRFGEVLALTAEALRDLRRLGQVKELAAALFNRGLALLALGDLEAAARAAEAAHAEARARGVPQLEIYADLLEGEICRRRGAPAEALVAVERAEQSAQALGAVRELVVATAVRAETLADLGRFGPAEAALAAAEAAARGEEDHDRVLLAGARVALAQAAAAGPGAAVPSAAGLLERLAPACRRLRDSGRLDQAWRAELCAARLARRGGDGVAAEQHLTAARSGWAAIVERAPEARRAGLESDPDARALVALEAETFGQSTVPRASSSSPGAATPALAGAATAPVTRQLIYLSKRLNSELRLDRLLDDVIDAVIELTSAERGFLLLYDDAGALQVRVARNIDQRELAGPDLALSRSIAERAARTGEPVLTASAADDERFGAAASVSALRLRSVLSVPLRSKGRVVGAVYVDHRFRRGAFSDDASQLVLDLADVAAVALANAQLVAESEGQRREIAALNARLEGQLEEKQAELDGARAQLAAGKGLELRYAYDALIGRSPRMLELLRLVDRATATALPVVIHGESGTGKELVARALHGNGARADNPFVAINCAAMPETLLEAELFGHARGAFTGADRDRRGLFEVADRGTLFLDEIADTSPAMQTKLLRVLQDGEVRRVGGDRPRTVDVRVVAASNKDLRRLVDAGKFREDLFYRLHVIRIDVPPLRERSEDIPALVTYFLERVARDAGAAAPRRVDRAAMGRLLAYAWPGNVRELENELHRAAALGGEVIGVADLSPAVAAADPTAPPVSPGDLTLRPRVEHLERSLLREALAKAAGNQTQAAKLLGLSRFGLQKKLRRYGL